VHRSFASLRMTNCEGGERTAGVESLLLHIGIEHSFLFQIMRHRVLRQKWRLQADFGTDPFAFGVRRIRSVIATAAAAELRSKIGGLDLVELVDLTPGLVAYRAGNVDLEFQNRHRSSSAGAKAHFFSDCNAALKGPLFHDCLSEF
jgi:hypothetical protein